MWNYFFYLRLNKIYVIKKQSSIGFALIYSLFPPLSLTHTFFFTLNHFTDNTNVDVVVAIAVLRRKKDEIEKEEEENNGDDCIYSFLLLRKRF